MNILNNLLRQSDHLGQIRSYNVSFTLPFERDAAYILFQDVSVAKLCNSHVTTAKDKLCVYEDQMRGL